MSDKAEKTYQAAMQCFSKRSTVAFDVPEHMISWASTILKPEIPSDVESSDGSNVREYKIRKSAFRSGDTRRSFQLINDALAMGAKLPSSQQLRLTDDAIDVYSGMERNDLSKPLVQRRDALIQHLEKSPVLSERQIEYLASSLVTIAARYQPIIRRDDDREPTVQYEGPPADSEDPVKRKADREQNCKIAESYRLRAMVQYNRLKPTNHERIDAQRQMVYYYRGLKQADKEAVETQKLSRLLNSRDPNVLFPKSFLRHDY